MTSNSSKSRAACLAAVLVASLSGTVQAEGSLSIYHWFDYIPQELLDKFSAENNIEVTMDTYDSNEAMFAALKAGKMGSYDVAVPSDYMTEIMIGEGVLDSYERAEMPNFDNIEEQWVDVGFDPGRKHSIPYQWGSTSFSVNRDVFEGDISSTSIIFDPPESLVGKINVLDSQGEVLALASIHLGIPQCSQDRDQLKALNALLEEVKPKWASFNSDGAKEVLVSGEAVAGMIFNGYSARARNEGANIEYSYPNEGHVLWMDNVVLLKDAPNRENALTFMNFLLEPENIAAVTEYAQYISGVKGVTELLSEELKTSPENNPPADATAGSFIQVCDEQTQSFYDQIWTNLKK